jgi:hypothetical protein
LPLALVTALPLALPLALTTALALATVNALATANATALYTTTVLALALAMTILFQGRGKYSNQSSELKQLKKEITKKRNEKMISKQKQGNIWCSRTPFGNNRIMRETDRNAITNKKNGKNSHKHNSGETQLIWLQ